MNLLPKGIAEEKELMFMLDDYLNVGFKCELPMAVMAYLNGIANFILIRHNSLIREVRFTAGKLTENSAEKKMDIQSVHCRKQPFSKNCV